MSSSKAALKTIKAAIDTGDFEKAITQAQDLVKQDAQNYTGFMFLGFAHEKLGHLEQAEAALLSALQLKHGDIQAFKGLITLYEKQGRVKLDQYHDIVSQLAQIYANLEDVQQCQIVIDKYEVFARKHGSGAQYRRALELTLPTHELYKTLEGRVPHPGHTYKRILESTEADEREWINTQIGERRTRLGARIDQVTREVKFEAIDKFDVEQKYQWLIDWTNDDDIRHDLEERLLQRAYDNLLAVTPDLKPSRRDRVLTTANGMVIIKHRFPLAWNIALEWVDAEGLDEWDVNIFREYIDYFPDEGLAKVLRGFLDSNASPFPDLPINGDKDEDVPEKLSEADQLIMMNEGLDQCHDSMLAHRIMAHTYLSFDEHESAAEFARKSRTLYQQAQFNFALSLQDSLDAVNLTLANALITYQSPRHHPEARTLFNEILQRKPKLTAALLGLGLILEEDEDYAEAVKFLKQASERDPDNLRIRLEYAWCHALDNDLNAGLTELDSVLAEIEGQKSPDLVMKSETLYRIAYCKWEIDPSASARKDKTGPYRYLIDSIKANSTYAPAYTLLGIYFQDYGKSKQRARVALQKAFELSTSELIAAERLARAFANGGEWDLVELVANRVVDSGKARPAPGSKKKAFSWPYAALGVVQMNRQQYSQSIVSFQAALRISPQDYHSWVGLGESYHNSGRYIAASRAFARAESIEHGLSIEQAWFARYMLANVQREMGAFDDAISAYEAVLEIKKDEFGVLVALVQTCAENAWTKTAQGLFGRAIKLSRKAINVAQNIANQKAEVFNMWKAVGDACAIFGHAKAFSAQADIDTFWSLLETGLVPEAIEILADVDKINMQSLKEKTAGSTENTSDWWLQASILANKRAVHASAHDSHAQAVAWYNLGWSEYEAYASAGPSLMIKGKKPTRLIKAAMRCFKRAIELEAGNSDFWNALGVVTMNLSPKVSQHSFVRSLHLNDHSARTWTNLGVLYLVNNDSQLANEAFTKAQSADPDYADAWIGQGLLAMLYGNTKEARGLFTHAFGIADSTSLPAKRYYTTSSFDYLLSDIELSREISSLLQPLFALRQLRTQQPLDSVNSHLLSLYAERVGEFDEGIEALEKVCDIAEAQYEKSESNDLLVRFAQAKADLARAQLGKGDYEAAAENAQTALDLSAEDDLGPAYAAQRQKWCLSARITAGLAHSYLGSAEESIKMFQTALESSNHAPDIVCMLAQVLWAKGGQAEKDAARTQLFDCVENHPDHVQAVILLSVIGLLDQDEDVLEAVEDDLKAFRLNDKVSVIDKMKVSKVLAGIISSKSAQSGNTSSETAISDALTGIMLSPAQPQGWLELAQSAKDEYAAEMALSNAKNQVPPYGRLAAEDLASAYANTGRDEDVLLATVLAPWVDHGYDHSS